MSFVLRLGHNFLCLSLIVALGGCGQSSKKQPDASATQTTEEQPKVEAQTKDTEPAENSCGCPNHDDVRKSITGAKTLIAEIRATMHDSKVADFPDRAQALEAKLAIWQKKNETLTNNCSMLLGADGTEVYPEIPLALENLTLSGEWMKTSIDTASANTPRASGKYIKAAEKAIKQASRVLDKKVKPNRRTAVVHPPH